MLPASRTQLKEYCFRKLGAPVVDINVDADQVEDRIDEALLMFQQHHYDGSQKWYTSHAVTQEDIDNKYIQMNPDVIGVTRMFTISSSQTNSAGQGGFNMFDINYQIRLNELYDYTAGDYVYFELANEHLRMLEMLFTGEIPIRYNRYTNKCWVDMIWEVRVSVGQYIIFEVFRQLDPTSALWGDEWLMLYSTALIKRQWGENLKLFNSVTLPGGMILNGQRIYDEAVVECARLEQRLKDEFTQPVEFLVG